MDGRGAVPRPLLTQGSPSPTFSDPTLPPGKGHRSLTKVGNQMYLSCDGSLNLCKRSTQDRMYFKTEIEREHFIGDYKNLNSSSPSEFFEVIPFNIQHLVFTQWFLQEKYEH